LGIGAGAGRIKPAYPGGRAGAGEALKPGGWGWGHRVFPKKHPGDGGGQPGCSRARLFNQRGRAFRGSGGQVSPEGGKPVGGAHKKGDRHRGRGKGGGPGAGKKSRAAGGHPNPVGNSSRFFPRGAGGAVVLFPGAG